jgi:hypothetical protein
VASSLSWTSERLPPKGPAKGPAKGQAQGPAQLPTMSHMTAAHTANRRARFPRLVVSLAGVD